MSTDTIGHIGQPPMTVAELVAFTKKELDADAERHAKLQAAGAVEVPKESQNGATLDLSHKNIHALPVEVIGLIKDKVERLALSHNPQISIPSQIVQCDRIRYLNIRWNQLTQFPGAILQLSKLEILDLSKNRIVSIPEDINRLTSLKFLAVARNRITRLPLAIGDMTSLSKLKFDENPIEFPPLEALKASKESTSSSSDVQSSQETCQIIKKLLKDTANKDRTRITSEEELSESGVETPRPPRRTFTAGRFPIKPSVSGIDNASDPLYHSPSNHVPPPIPQRSHARVASSTATNTFLAKRPGIAPLLVNGNDVNRSRSETAPSSASLRSRRQGFVPTRRVTESLNPVSETASQASSRLSQASTIKANHSRATSSVSTVNSFLAASSGEGSSDAISPVHGPGVRFDEMHGLSSPPRNRKQRSSADTVKGSKRLLFTLYQLQRPINEVAAAIKVGTPKRSNLERQAFSANAQVAELDRLLQRLQNGLDDGATRKSSAMKAIVRTSLLALKSYSVVTSELKRNTSKLVQVADGVYVRCLMFQIYSTMVEARNICTVLGAKLRECIPKETPRTSQAWSSKSITPTQAKPPTSRRMRVASPLRNMTSNTTLRMMPPPPVPLNTNTSRSNTMTSIGAQTPRSGESFSSLASRDPPVLLRTNTMHSVMDLGDNDEQFDRIFLKLKAACDLAGHALPHCRLEFNTRRENAHNAGQRTLAHHWSMALKKCEIVITHNKTLQKRLEVVKVNDPGIRYQRDFWQLCDAFVHSWADLATEVKDISSQRVDITTVKQVMRNVQKAVRDVSKTISHSPLYHHAVGTKGPDSAGPQGLAPPFPAGLPTAYPSAQNSQGSYVAGPATPLSAAIGPAAHSSIASTPSTAQPPGEYFPQQSTSNRSAHERNDTVMQQPRPPRRQQ